MLRTYASRCLALLTVTLSLTQIRQPARAESGARSLTITPIDSESKARLTAPVDELRHEVEAHPDDRTKRVALVRGLVMARDLDGALAEAKSWRAKDAYNLVAVRALGDVYMERGEKEEAERVYSAIVELLPRDTDAQRSLATLLKQRGDLPAAEARLHAAVDSRPDDARILFELADVELRMGKNAPATERLVKVIDAKETSEQIRHPAKLRLAQLLAEERREAKAKGDAPKGAELSKRIEALGLQGGLENDIHVYLTWDTDRTDVDLWVTTPVGEKVFYSHRQGASGEALYDDVTTGYGPESFTVKAAARGEYVVQVNYFGGRRGAFPEARGEVLVVLDEGRPTEKKTVLPYRLFAEKDTVTVARIKVGAK
jgi:thioredoxin-like negative regulator of GroEL